MAARKLKFKPGDRVRFAHDPRADGAVIARRTGNGGYILQYPTHTGVCVWHDSELVIDYHGTPVQDPPRSGRLMV